MSTKMMIGLFIGLLSLLIAFNSFFIVHEGQAALVLRLGELKHQSDGNAVVYQPGLHMKLPIIEKVRKLDVRLQNLEAESPRILTKEQKYLYVDYYAKWRIADVSLYYQRTGGFPLRAQQLMTQKINDSLRAQFGKKELQEVVSDDRVTIMSNLQQSANEGAQGLGIEIADVRIKSIDLLKEVQESVFKRMSTKREQVATEYRSEGKATAEEVRSRADADAAKLLADASQQAQKVRAQGDALAAKIFSAAYSKDPVFYAFYRSLEAYRQVFSNSNNIMVLNPNSEFFKYFHQLPSKTG